MALVQQLKAGKPCMVGLAYAISLLFKAEGKHLLIDISVVVWH